MLKHLSQKFSINLGVDFLWNNKISCTSPVNRLVTNTFRFPFCLQCRLYILPHNVSEPSRTIRRPCDVIYLFKAKANSFQTFILYKCIFLCKVYFSLQRIPLSKVDASDVRVYFTVSSQLLRPQTTYLHKCNFVPPINSNSVQNFLTLTTKIRIKSLDLVFLRVWWLGVNHQSLCMTIAKLGSMAV